jgi:ribonuclease HI
VRELRPVSLLAGNSLTARPAGSASPGSPREITLYTDGACSGNPGPGGWAAIIIDGDQERIVSGAEPRTTNQRMELMAAIEGLAAIPEGRRVHVHSDSAYVVNGFRERWWERWEKNGWKNAQKQPVVNRDLWERLIAESRRHDVVWHKVAGHADDALNNRVDALARGAITG